jgi:broad specificity phosphatase PhoE
MRRLLLIKHSVPEIVPDIPASRWRLSAAGQARCSVLARHVAPYAPSHIVASTEPKARKTARLLGKALGIGWSSTEGLHEHERDNAPFLGAEEFEATVARFFAKPGVLVFGRETADAARERFSSAIAGVLRQHPQGSLAVVAHGTVITLFVARTNEIDQFAFWRRLGLPAMVVLGLPDCGLVAVVEQAGE